MALNSPYDFSDNITTTVGIHNDDNNTIMTMNGGLRSPYDFSELPEDDIEIDPNHPTDAATRFAEGVIKDGARLGKTMTRRWGMVDGMLDDLTGNDNPFAESAKLNYDEMNEGLDGVISGVEANEQRYKKQEYENNPKKYSSPDDVWNVSGGLGETMAWLIGGSKAGMSNARTKVGRLADNAWRNAKADGLTSTALNYGEGDGWGEKAVADSVMGAGGVFAGQVGGAALSKMIKSGSNWIKTAAKTATERGELLNDMAVQISEKTGADVNIVRESLQRESAVDIVNKGVDEDQVGVNALLDEFGVRASKGQREGNLLQQKDEVDVLQGHYTEGSQREMQDFMDGQYEDINNSAGNLRKSLGSEVDVTDRVEAADMVKSKVNSDYEILDGQVQSAYKKVNEREGFAPTSFYDDLKQAVSVDDQGKSVNFNEKRTPQAVELMNELETKIKKLAPEESNPFKNIPEEIDFTELEDFRRIINDGIGAAKATGNRVDVQRSFMIKRKFDTLVDDYVDRKLLSGDVDFIEKLKTARSLRAKQGELYQSEGKGKSPKNFIEMMIHEDPTPEVVADFIMAKGASSSQDRSLPNNLRYLKKLLGEDSKEWAAIRQSTFHKIIEATKTRDMKSVGAIATEIQNVIKNSPSTMKVLYTTAEQEKLMRFAKMMEHLKYKDGAVNYSNTFDKLVNWANKNIMPMSGFIDEGKKAITGHRITQKALEPSKQQAIKNYGMGDESGGIKLQLMAGIAGGGTGAALGFTQGDTMDERIQNAAIGAGLGAGAPTMLKKTAKLSNKGAIGGRMAKEPPEYGWFSSMVDKKPRFEIDDSGAKIIGNIPRKTSNGDVYYKGTLGDVLDHEELYKHYPELKNMSIGESGQDHSVYNAPGKYSDESIGISDMYIGREGRILPAGKRTSLHEVQHAIQEREGFAKGGNPEMFKEQAEAFEYKDALAWARELRKKKKEFPDADLLTLENKLTQDYKEMGLGDLLPSKFAREIARQPDILYPENYPQNNTFKNLEGIIRKYGLDKRIEADSGDEVYRRLAGEHEARDVSHRMFLTPEERMRTPFGSSEDYRVDDLIVK